MKIVFYSASSLRESEPGKTMMYPLRSEEWDQLADKHQNYEMYLVCSKWNFQLKEIWEDGAFPQPEKLHCIGMSDSADNEEYVKIISSLNPDVAVGITNMSFPYDWNPIRDALIAEKLEKKGIKTFAHQTFTAIGAFDKWRTNIMMRMDDFPVARGLYIHHDLFFIETMNPMAGYNVYKEYALDRVKNLPYPVIIKGTTGVGSIGMEVAGNFEEAKKIICSENNREDLLVEEFVEGEIFGTEIHGAKGNFSVLPPFRYTSGSSGVTNPMSSIKFGPITDEKYHVKELQEMLLGMAEKFNFKGITQVDLIFHEGKWVIVEINPRWSGSTILTSAAENRTEFDIFMDMVTGESKSYSDMENLKYVCDFKLFGVPEETVEKIKNLPTVKYAWKYRNPVDNSLVLELVVGGVDSHELLLDSVLEIEKQYGEYMADTIVPTMKELVK